MLNIELPKLVDPDEKQCKGLVFRGYRSTFVYDGHIGTRSGLKLLKRKSCKGCPDCKQLWDAFQQDMNECPDSWDEGRIEAGKLYRITITDKHVDWESGILDDWTWGAVEIKDAE